MAFRGDSTDTYTYASNSTGGTVDLGARNNYRYINATNVYNKGKSDGVTTHTGTYTFPSNDTGGTKDLGVSHTYRYINASNVYNKGKADGHPFECYLNGNTSAGNGALIFAKSWFSKYSYINFINETVGVLGNNAAPNLLISYVNDMNNFSWQETYNRGTIISIKNNDSRNYMLVCTSGMSSYPTVHLIFY